jgi:hypothetical protein
MPWRVTPATRENSFQRLNFLMRLKLPTNDTTKPLDGRTRLFTCIQPF